MIDQETIHNHCLSRDPDERFMALVQLKLNFSLLADKQQAWNDLHRLTNDRNSDVRRGAIDVLSSVFSGLRDKQQAWNDLHRLTNDRNSDVRIVATYTIGFSFSHVPDKQQAWNDLLRLTNDRNFSVRYGAARSLGSAFIYAPDRLQAWEDLHRLINKKDYWVKRGCVETLDYAFHYIPDKQQAWEDLHRLTYNKKKYFRAEAANIIGFEFYYIPDKLQAWNDLNRLINDKVNLSHYIYYHLGLRPINPVKVNATFAISSAFPYLPDKQQAWNNLYKLTNDKIILVRAYANHSLGKISIFKASQAENEEDYKNELENAIRYFEKSAYFSSRWDNPAQFCLPFYRTFHTIIFECKGSEEVNKYLKEAKAAVEGSKSKRQLFEAVENLAEALKEVQNIESIDFDAKKEKLNSYRKYCDRAAELIKYTEETAPFATIAMRKGLPILDRNLKGLLEEIKEKAKVACKESKGTATEEIVCAINKEVQKWEMGSQEEMAFNLENLIFTLEANTPNNLQSKFILDRIKQIPEQKYVARQYGMLSSIITLIIKSTSEQKLHEIGEKVDNISDKLEEITISLKPGISEELIIHVGPITQWGGIEYTVTIPLRDISYPELKEDLQKIVGTKIDKLCKLPKRLANKVTGYLLLHDKNDILEKLT